MTRLIITILLFALTSCDKQVKIPEERHTSGELRIAPPYKISDSIYLPEFKGWLYSIIDISSSESVGCELIVIDSGKQQIIIPTLKYTIADHTIDEFNAIFDYNWSELINYINSNNYIANNIGAFKDDLRLILNRYINIKNHTFASDSLLRLQSNYYDSTRTGLSLLGSGFDNMQFNYSNDLILVYYPKTKEGFKIAGLEYQNRVSIRHYGNNPGVRYRISK